MKTTKHTLAGLRPVAIILASLFAATAAQAGEITFKNGNVVQINSTASDYTSDSVALGNSHLSESLGNLARVPLKNAFAAGNSRVDYNANNSVALGNSSVDIHSQDAIAAGSSQVGKGASQSTAINKSTVGEGVKEALAAGNSRISSGGHYSVALSGSKVEGDGIVRNSLATGQSEVTGKYSVALTDSKVNAVGSIATNGSRIESGADGSVALVASRVGQDAANSVAIGKAQVSASSGVAIGRGALSGHKNSVALGAESQTDRENSVSVGNINQTKNITHVSDGKEDTDAVNKRQLDNVGRKADRAISVSQKASSDADNAVTQSTTALNVATVTAKSLEKETQARMEGDAATLTAANSHTDNSVQASNQRTDSLIVREQADRTAAIKAEEAARIKGDATTLTNANSFTRERETVVNQRTDGLLRTEQQARVKGDADTLMAANAHSDANDAKTLTSANTHTDNSVQASDARTDTLLAGEQQARIDGDARTLKSANHYTDWRVENVTAAASAETLHKSQTYTDRRFGEAKAYTDSKFGQLSNKIERAEKRLNAGIAGVTAISSIPYVAENDFSYGVALGNYRNGNALAGGIQKKLSPNTNVRLNVSWDSSSNTALGVGFAGGW